MLIPDKLFIERVKSVSEEMPISKVVLFFQRENIIFTKTMIQNYVRVGVLPPPADKRYYTKNHILLLYLIDKFKQVYSLDEIKNILSSAVYDYEAGRFTVDMFLVCRCYFEFYENCINDFLSQLPDLSKEAKIVASSQSYGESFSKFLIKFAIMTQSTASKDITETDMDI